MSLKYLFEFLHFYYTLVGNIVRRIKEIKLKFTEDLLKCDLLRREYFSVTHMNVGICSNTFPALYAYVEG